MPDWLDILPPVLAVAGLHHDGRIRAFKCKRLTSKAGQLLIAQPRIAGYEIEHVPIGTRQTAALGTDPSRVQESTVLIRLQHATLPVFFYVRVERGQMRKGILIDATVLDHPGEERLPIPEII